MSSKVGFYGVYLLVSENPQYKGRTYIGFTVDPARRLHQHNRGSHAQGAWRTSHRGPWSMVLITHGFPNEVSALRVEWAWQNPEKSRRLRSAPKKKSSESQLEFRVRLLGCLLQTTPWCALPLTVTWLHQNYFVPFPEGFDPPSHMSIIPYCDINDVKKNYKITQKSIEEKEITSELCSVCSKNTTEEDRLTCIHENCPMTAHIICLANHFLKTPTETSHPSSLEPPWKKPPEDLNPPRAPPLLPVEGRCPKCRNKVLWGDLVRPLSVACASSRGINKGKGVWKGRPSDDSPDEDATDEDVDDEDHWANMLSQK